MIDVLKGKEQVPPMQLQVKLQKTEEITDLESNIQETKYRLTYLEVWKNKEKVQSMFYRPKDCMKTKSKCYIFSGYKQTNDVRFGLFRVETATSSV